MSCPGLPVVPQLSPGREATPGQGYPAWNWGTPLPVTRTPLPGTAVPSPCLRLGYPTGTAAPLGMGYLWKRTWDQRPGKNLALGYPQETMGPEAGKGPMTRDQVLHFFWRGQAHTCENSTFPTLRMRAVINECSADER